MSDIAITVNNLGKWFNTSYRPNGLRETLSRSSQYAEKKENGFWALRNVSFEVPKGEVFGIVGHNGAGKSVLLKILTGITNPTEGEARIEGRIGALLELGTGFHMELSGRDNIFLNGSFLGMRPWEIEEKLEEIIDFSGIRHAINEPVKHYSSGMTMRLAFSIAVTLAPEVIFLDEVWAVGDMDFQKKAFDKIRQIISDGRTVMIVSHSLDTVASVTTSCILMDHGRMVDIGDSRQIIRSYLAAASKPGPARPAPAKVEVAEEVHKPQAASPADPTVAAPSSPATPQSDQQQAQAQPKAVMNKEPLVAVEDDEDEDTSETLAVLLNAQTNQSTPAEKTPQKSEPEALVLDKPRYQTRDFQRGIWSWGGAVSAPGSSRIRLKEIRLINASGELVEEFFIGEPMTVQIYYQQANPEDSFMVGLAIQDLYGSYILASHTQIDSAAADGTEGVRCVSVTIPGRICSMTYRLSVMMGAEENFRYEPDIFLTDMIRFKVLPQLYQDIFPINLSGAMNLELEWEVSRVDQQQAA